VSKGTGPLEASLLACEDSARATAAAVAEKTGTIETARAFRRQHAGRSLSSCPLPSPPGHLHALDTLPMPAPFSLHDLGRVFDARSLISERGLVLIGWVEVRFRGETIAADPVKERMPPLVRTAQRCRR
jgi:hypothetical protein